MPRWRRRNWPHPGPSRQPNREVVGALVAMLRCLNEQVTALEQQLTDRLPRIRTR